MLSDFIDENFEDALKVAGKKHDVIGIKVYDKMDMQLPEIGLIEIEDAESGKRGGSIQQIYLYDRITSRTFFHGPKIVKIFFLKQVAIYCIYGQTKIM